MVANIYIYDRAFNGSDIAEPCKQCHKYSKRADIQLDLGTGSKDLYITVIEREFKQL